MAGRVDQTELKRTARIVERLMNLKWMVDAEHSGMRSGHHFALETAKKTNK